MQSLKKIAIIGLGRFGIKLFDRFNEYNKIKFVCKKHLDDKILDLKKKHGFEIHNNYKKILDQIDLAVIATPSDTHYTIVKDCLLNGVDVFVEKPLSINLTEAKELVNIAKKKKLKLYVDDIFLYRKEYQELKKTVQGKDIKEIKFTWKKYGTFKDSIVNALVYHDMYLLVDLIGKKKISNLKIIKFKDPLKKGRCDILEFQFDYNGIKVECNYDRTFNGKKKNIEIIFGTDKNKVEWNNNKVIMNDNEIIFKDEDALSLLILNFLNNKVDYSKNNLLALKSIECIEKIKKEILN